MGSSVSAELPGTAPLSSSLHNSTLLSNLPVLAPGAAVHFNTSPPGSSKRVIESMGDRRRLTTLKQSGAGAAALVEALPDVTLQPLPTGQRLAEIPPKQRRSRPFRAIGRLLTRFPNSSDTYVGSATVVGGNVLLTAAHNVHEAARGGFAHTIEFQPGYDDGAGGSEAGIWMATRAIAHAAWTAHRNFQYDFALLVVHDASGRRIADTCGRLEVAAYPSLKRDRTLLGYPVGHPYLGNEMMREDCSRGGVDDAYKSDQPMRVYCSLGKGMSGGPWLYVPAAQSQPAQVVGLTSYSREQGTLYSPWFGSVFRAFYEGQA